MNRKRADSLRNFERDKSAVTCETSKIFHYETPDCLRGTDWYNQAANGDSGTPPDLPRLIAVVGTFQFISRESEVSHVRHWRTRSDRGRSVCTVAFRQPRAG